ncbi:MAG: hypothetical protein K940chlam7_01697, partial [Chlamydiae bacterium]|nr:hypothetical protein [Chlamydiota bacterium]
IIGAAIKVHRTIGPGLLESIYEECLAKEFELQGIQFERQKSLPVFYEGIKLNCKYRFDFLVEREVVVELKCTDMIPPIFCSQVLTYLRLLNRKIGLIINFNIPVLHEGVKRIINNYYNPLQNI